MDFLGRLARRQLQGGLGVRSRRRQVSGWLAEAPVEVPDAAADPGTAVSEEAVGNPPRARPQLGRPRLDGHDVAKEGAEARRPAAQPRIDAARAPAATRPPASPTRNVRAVLHPGAPMARDLDGRSSGVAVSPAGPTASLSGSALVRPVIERPVRSEVPTEELPDETSSLKPANTAAAVAADAGETRPMRVATSAEPGRGPADHQEVTVTVTIGRLEVRGTPSPPTVALPVAAKKPGLSLEDYLERRHGAAR